MRPAWDLVARCTGAVPWCRTMRPSGQLVVGFVVGSALGAAGVAAWHGSRSTEGASAPTVPRAVASLTGSAVVPHIATPVGPAATTVPALQAQNATLRAELVELRNHRDTLQAMYDAVVPKRTAQAQVHPSPEVLREWAKICRTRWDYPNFDKAVQTEFTDQGRANPSEYAVMQEVLARMHAGWLAVLREAYIEVTGDTSGAKTLEPDAMQSEIANKGAQDEINSLRERLSQERAGLVTPPAVGAKMSALERHFRSVASLGDDTEAALAVRVGAARARAIRGAGWGSSMTAQGCTTPAVTAPMEP